MRGKDIQVGEEYAVVASRYAGCEASAVKGRVLDKGASGGRWLVAFDEPTYVTYGQLKPASKGEPHYYGQKPTPVTEHEFDSRQLLAAWDEHVATLDQEKRAQQSLADRLQTEQELVESALAEIREVLTASGAVLEAPFAANPTKTWGEEPRWLAALTMPPEIVVEVARLLRQGQDERTLPEREKEGGSLFADDGSSLASLLNPLLQEEQG